MFRLLGSRLLLPLCWGMLLVSPGVSDLVEDLMQMSDAELERICTERGFDLAQGEWDDEAGEVITFHHEDYVEAARQCLSLEVQVEQIIRDNPELIPAFEKDLERLQKEKKQLTERMMDVERAKYFANLANNEAHRGDGTVDDIIDDEVYDADIQELMAKKRALELERDEKLAAKARLEAALEAQQIAAEASLAAASAPSSTHDGIPESHFAINEIPQPATVSQTTTDETTSVASMEEHAREQLSEMGHTVGELLPRPIRAMLVLTGKAVITLSGDVTKLLRFVQRHIRAIVNNSVKMVGNKRRGAIHHQEEEGGEENESSREREKKEEKDSENDFVMME